jgi:predicted AAA+ superfamily ATPase
MTKGNFPRHLRERMDIAMQDTPVVLINGPRQSGKSTLVKQYSPSLPYFTLDDDNILSVAKYDPMGFISGIGSGTIDEIQRAPELFRAIKLSVDQNRKPGRFLLTGSANLLALPQIGDSLAGRMEVLTLLPLSLAEIERRNNDFLHCAQNQSWLPPSKNWKQLDVEQILTGGYPELYIRDTPSRRNAWAKSYIKAIVERDVKDISSIEKLVEMPRLLEMLAHQSGKLTNFTQMGGQIGLDTKTTQKYTGLLETLFLVNQLRVWHGNALNRIIKTPKIYFLDSGLLAALSRCTSEGLQRDRSLLGPLLETWVYGELLKAMTISEDESWDIYYYRDKDQVEVDFVLENHARKVIGIEVKASSTVAHQDFRGLRKLASLAGKDWISGIVLYNGTQCLSFKDNLWAIPFSLLGGQGNH